MIFNHYMLYIKNNLFNENENKIIKYIDAKLLGILW